MSILLIVLASLALAPALASTPHAYQAEYEVLRNGSVLGTAEIRVAAGADGLWTMSSQTRGTRGMAALVGIDVRENSRFHWSADAIETVEYDYHQRAATRSRERSVRVDPGAGRIRTTDREREQLLDYQPAVLDRQILPLAIARDVAAGGDAPLVYQVVDRGEIDEHRYRVGARERVETGSGTVEAVRVERVRPGSDRTTTLWLDPARDHIPVRVVQREDRDTIETRLLSLQREAAPPR